MTDEEFARGKHLDTEFGYSIKALDVVCNNSLRLTGDSHLRNHIVVWVS
jgi:hypothetical protein